MPLQCPKSDDLCLKDLQLKRNFSLRRENDLSKLKTQSENTWERHLSTSLWTWADYRCVSSCHKVSHKSLTEMGEGENRTEQFLSSGLDHQSWNLSWVEKKHLCFFSFRLGQNQRHAGVTDTDNKLGDANYSFREAENRTESFRLLFLWSGWCRGTKKRGTSFPSWKPWLLSLQTTSCLLGEHTTAGCGSDPCHDIISKVV